MGLDVFRIFTRFSKVMRYEIKLLNAYNLYDNIEQLRTLIEDP